MTTLGLFFTFGLILLVDCIEEQKKCGYDSCNPGKPGMKNVHIVCHTHDDVGWLKTLDQYYNELVRSIITTVVQELNNDPERRFVYVESAFFRKWWLEQKEEVKKNVSKLVDRGQLQFVGGGWVMNDEASTDYESIIDQMTLGQRFLNDTFGECSIPRTVWQIDPFGHSRQQASLFKQMNFDGMFLGRIDYQDFEFRKAKKNLEFIWRGSNSLGRNSDIFTGILPNVYWPPKHFCFDIYCADEEITDLNADRRSKEFLRYVEKQFEAYRTNHTIITMGMDFHFSEASKWFRNLGKLISYINSMQKNGSLFNAFYSTPTCYLKSLNSEKLTWDSESSDFFPYADQAHAYWTGYFTSRPTLKYYTRRAAAFLQICKQVAVIANKSEAKISPLKEAVSVLQHHDGISGTEKQHVANDYAQMLSTGMTLCQEEVKSGLSTFSLKDVHGAKDLQFCDNLNTTECHVTEKENMFGVILYNPLSRNVSHYLRLPVQGQGYEVLDGSQKKLDFQIVPLPSFLSGLSNGKSEAKFELVFLAEIPAMGSSAFTVKRHQDFAPVDDRSSIVKQQKEGQSESYSIGNEFLKVNLNSLSGLMESVTLGKVETPIKQSFFYYMGDFGYHRKKASGAYAFCPMYQKPTLIFNTPKITIVKGTMVEEAVQVFDDWVKQVIRVYKGKPYVELDWIVGPIPQYGSTSGEVITKFETNWKTEGIFYTDSNNRESMMRKRDTRPTWNLTVDEPVSGNYYPVTGWIYIEDKPSNRRLTILTDRAQGGSSIDDGHIELMVHRRTLHDDGYGVEEPLNEKGPDGHTGLVVRGRHILLFNEIQESTRLMREVAKELYHQPSPIFLPMNGSYKGSLSSKSALKINVPRNVHILTLEAIGKDQVLIRLEHIYEANENKIYSTPVTVSLKNLFCSFEVTSMLETTLTANQYLKDAQKLKWNYKVEDQPEKEEPPSNEDKDLFKVLLKPMQIRTFILNVKRTTC